MDPEPIYAELTTGAHDADRGGGRTVLDLLRAVEVGGGEEPDEVHVGVVPGVLTFPVA